MTARELLFWLDKQTEIVALLLVLPVLLAYLLHFIHGKDKAGQPPWKYVYSFFVYLACVPGILALVLVAYTLFFTRENLLDVNLLVTFGPIVSMGLTLVFIRRAVGFDRLPGFQRLSGLLVMIAATFAIVLIISKTRIWLFFGGSIFFFIAFSAAIFGLLKWGAAMAFRSRNQPPPRPPSFPGL